MGPQDDELKARLLKGFEAVIDRLLANKPVPEEITLRYVESTAVAAGEKVKEVIARQLLQHHREQPHGVACPGCGKQLGMKDYRSRQVVTEAGEVRVRRAYYYCEDCRAGVFPPGCGVGTEPERLFTGLCPTDGVVSRGDGVV
jgi:hypothetical protein